MMRARKSNVIRSIAAAVLISVAPASHGVIYKWVNEDGTITYSDEPPPDSSTIGELSIVVPPTFSIEVRPSEPPDAERARGEGAASAPGMSGSDPEATPRITVRPALPDAVRDPCLTSSDPRCHEKNRHAYVPYQGYTPNARQAARPADVVPPIGATGGSAAGGVVQGGAGTAPRVAPPKSSTYAFPPGSERPLRRQVK